MSSERVEEKASEMVDSLAKTTGVGATDVKKILDSLGLSESLTHREYQERSATRIGNTVSRRLGDVTVGNLRIASGDLEI